MGSLEPGFLGGDYKTLEFSRLTGVALLLVSPMDQPWVDPKTRISEKGVCRQKDQVLLADTADRICVCLLGYVYISIRGYLYL